MFGSEDAGGPGGPAGRLSFCPLTGVLWIPQAVSSRIEPPCVPRDHYTWLQTLSFIRIPIIWRVTAIHCFDWVVAVFDTRVLWRSPPAPNRQPTGESPCLHACGLLSESVLAYSSVYWMHTAGELYDCMIMRAPHPDRSLFAAASIVHAP